MAEGPPVIRLAVFGRPVAHSLSPTIHRLFGEQCGITVDYRAIEAQPDTFASQVRDFAAAGARGCNVTVPFKGQAWALAHRCSNRAALAQAANTLDFRDGDGWFADNTDGQGLVDDLRGLPGADPAGRRVCLLGAGGAAAGILGALLEAGPARITIVNRTRRRAEELAARHAALGALECCEPSEAAAAAPFDLCINATSLGHAGEAPALPAAWLNPGALCYDLNYGPAADPLRRRCAASGIRYADGLGMLVGQAALSFELWTGRRPDRAAVLRRLR